MGLKFLRRAVEVEMLLVVEVFWRFSVVAGVECDVCCSRLGAVAALKRVRRRMRRMLPRG